MASSPVAPQTFVVVGHNRVHRTADGGATFALCDPDPGPSGFSAYLAEFASDGRLYVASTYGVQVSLDGGATFGPSVRVAQGLMNTDFIQDIAVDPDEPNVLWAVYYVFSNGRGLARSTDGGATFVDVVPAGFSGQAWRVATDQIDGSRVLLVDRDGRTWWSTDAGSTWSQGASLVSNPDDCAIAGGNLVVAADRSVRVSSNGGATWSSPNVAYPGFLSLSPLDSHLDVEPGPNGRCVHSSAAGGSLVSADGGVTWSPLDGLWGEGVAVAEWTAGGALLAATQVRGLVRRDPSTSTLTTLDGTSLLTGAPFETSRVPSMHLDPADEERLVILASATSADRSIVLVSTDGGASWPDMRNFNEGPATCVGFDGNGAILVGSAPVDPTLPGACLHRENGSGWDPIGPPSVGLTALAVTAGIPTASTLHLLTSSPTFQPGSETFRLWRSVDDGATWTQLRARTTSRAVAPSGTIHVTGSGEVGFAIQVVSQASVSGIVRLFELSRDDGATWISVPAPTEFAVMAGARGANRLWQAWTAGSNPPGTITVESTLDGGASGWQRTVHPNPGPLQYIVSMASSPDADVAYGLVGSVMGSIQDYAVVRFTHGGADLERLPIAPRCSFREALTVGGNTKELLFVYGAGGLRRTEIAGSVGESRCGPALVHSGGVGAQLRMEGSASLQAADLEFVARRLPLGTFCLPLVGTAAATAAPLANSEGVLCLGGTLGRFNTLTANSGTTGSIRVPIDLTAIPLGGTLTSVTAGQTLHFQCWFRDVVGGAPTSNTTDAVEVEFVP